MGKKSREKRLRREYKAKEIDVPDKRKERVNNIIKVLKENIGKSVYIRLNDNYDDPVYIQGDIVSAGLTGVVLRDPYKNWGRFENDDEMELTDEEREYCSLAQDLDNIMGVDIDHDDFADYGLSMNKDETMNVSLNHIYDVIIDS